MIGYFTNAVQNHFADFKGRSSRSAFNYYLLLLFIINVVLSIFQGLFGEGSLMSSIIALISALVALVLFIPGFAIYFRRLHDLNMSGWAILLVLIPLVNLIFIIYMMAARGTVGANNYGEDPTDLPLGTTTPIVNVTQTPTTPQTPTQTPPTTM